MNVSIIRSLCAWTKLWPTYHLFCVGHTYILSPPLFALWLHSFNILGRTKFYETLAVGNLGMMTKVTVFSLLIAQQLEQCLTPCTCSTDLCCKTEWWGMMTFWSPCDPYSLVMVLSCLKDTFSILLLLLEDRRCPFHDHPETEALRDDP